MNVASGFRNGLAVLVMLAVGGAGAPSNPAEGGRLCSVHISLGETTVVEGQWADLFVALRNESSHPLGLPNNAHERVDILVRRRADGEEVEAWTLAFNAGRVSATIPGAAIPHAPGAAMVFEKVVMMDGDTRFLFGSPGRYELKARIRGIRSAEITEGGESNVVELVVRPGPESEDGRLAEVLGMVRARHRVDRKRVSFEDMYEAWRRNGSVHPQFSAEVGIGLLDRARGEQSSELARTGAWALVDVLTDADGSNDVVVARCIRRLIKSHRRWPSLLTHEVRSAIERRLDEEREYPASVVFAQLSDAYRAIPD